MEDRPAAVYRLWAQDGTLLYIGSAYDPEGRCNGHRDKPWWPLVASRTEEWHDGRVGAYIAEIEQIRREQPPHNVMGASRYAVPDTPGIRRRNKLSGIRARALVDGSRAREAAWEAARQAGYEDAEVYRLGNLAYIDVLDACGAWGPKVEGLRAEHEARYGAPSSAGQ